jgi:hypothetical protein
MLPNKRNTTVPLEIYCATASQNNRIVRSVVQTTIDSRHKLLALHLPLLTLGPARTSPLRQRRVPQLQLFSVVPKRNAAALSFDDLYTDDPKCDECQMRSPWAKPVKLSRLLPDLRRQLAAADSAAAGTVPPPARSSTLSASLCYSSQSAASCLPCSCCFISGRQEPSLMTLEPLPVRPKSLPKKKKVAPYPVTRIRISPSSR